MLLAGLALAGCSGRDGPAYEPVGENEVGVDLEGNAFKPAEVRAQRGQLVVWRNRTSDVQTVTADPALAADRRQVAVPPGASPFNSGRLAPGEVFRHRFTVPGTYRYVSLPHEAAGMRGTLIVEP